MIIRITFNEARRIDEFKPENIYPYWFVIFNNLGFIGVRKIESITKDNDKEYLVIDDKFEFLRADIANIEIM